MVGYRITNGCTATYFPPLRGSKPAREPSVPVDYVAWNRGAHFVRPCPVALRRNKALYLTAQPSNLRFAACSAGERRDYGNKDGGI